MKNHFFGLGNELLSSKECRVFFVKLIIAGSWLDLSEGSSKFSSSVSSDYSFSTLILDSIGNSKFLLKFSLNSKPLSSDSSSSVL